MKMYEKNSEGILETTENEGHRMKDILRKIVTGAASFCRPNILSQIGKSKIYGAMDVQRRVPEGRVKRDEIMNCYRGPDSYGKKNNQSVIGIGSHGRHHRSVRVCTNSRRRT